MAQAEYSSNSEENLITQLAFYREKLSPEKQDVFDNMQEAKQKMVKPGEVQKVEFILKGNVEFLEELQKISNIQEFFENFTLVEDRQLNINNEIVIDAKAFLQMTNDERECLLKSTYDLKSGKITENQFYKAVYKIWKKYRITFERKRESAIKKMKEAFEVCDMAELQVKGKSIFKEMNRHEIERLDNILYEKCRNYNKKHLKVSLKMAEELSCKSVAEFIAVLEYVVRRLDLQEASVRVNHKVQLNRGVKPKNHFFDIKADEFLQNPQAIVDDFQELRDICNSANTGYPRFGNSITAVNHYQKHSNFPQSGKKVEVSPTTYFKMATEICQGPMDDQKWTQDGKSLMKFYKSKKYEAVAVTYTNITNGSTVVATLMWKKEKTEQI